MENGTEQQPAASSGHPAQDIKQRFLDHFNLFPKGNPETTFTLLKYAVSSYKTFSGGPVTYDMIFSKWTEYVEKAQSENRDSKFMKSMEKFIQDKDFNTNFNPSLGGKSFLDKYS